MSPGKIAHLLQDVGIWARALAGVRRQQREGQGVDYLNQQDRRIERELVWRLHPERMRLKLARVIDETPSTRTLRFTRTDGPLPPFRPGQYVNLFLELEGVRTSRPFSIASAPGEAHLDLTVRRKPGGFVSPHLLDQLQPGDELECTGPQGSFRHEPLIDGDDLLLLAGGSGITPFMSMIRDQVRRGFPLRLTLLYGSRSPDDVIFGRELERLAAEHEGLRYELVISEPPAGYRGLSGLLDAELIRARAGDLEGKTVFVCGPNPMLALCRRALDRLGVPPYRVRVETFGPPDDITREPGWPGEVAADARVEVEVEGHGTVSALAGEPLMSSLERHGVVLPAVCRTGACSACRTRLLSGEVFIPPGVGLRESDRQAGYIHPCLAYPLTDLRIRLPGPASLL